jgi:hypothetical protein
MFNKLNDRETLRLRLQSFLLGSQAWRARSVRYRAKACVTIIPLLKRALFLEAQSCRLYKQACELHALRLSLCDLASRVLCIKLYL